MVTGVSEFNPPTSPVCSVLTRRGNTMEIACMVQKQCGGYPQGKLSILRIPGFRRLAHRTVHCSDHTTVIDDFISQTQLRPCEGYKVSSTAKKDRENSLPVSIKDQDNRARKGKKIDLTRNWNRNPFNILIFRSFTRRCTETGISAFLQLTAIKAFSAKMGMHDYLQRLRVVHSFLIAHLVPKIFLPQASVTI